MSNDIGPYKKQFRNNLFKEQNGLCFYCNKPMSLTNRKQNGQPARDFATFEHLKRVQQGGKTTSTNIVLIHTKCNRKKNIEFQAQLSTNQRDKGNKKWFKKDTSEQNAL